MFEWIAFWIFWCFWSNPADPLNGLYHIYIVLVTRFIFFPRPFDLLKWVCVIPLISVAIGNVERLQFPFGLFPGEFNSCTNPGQFTLRKRYIRGDEPPIINVFGGVQRSDTSRLKGKRFGFRWR